MHPESLDEMQKQLRLWEAYRFDMSCTVADIGSRDVNGVGTYKDLVPDAWAYVGFDAIFGDNVDLLMPSEFNTGMADASFDVVLCGQTLEHCRCPQLLVNEIARILKPGGRCFLVAPSTWERHRVPIDCWRIFPDGMQALLELAKLKVLGLYERFQEHNGPGVDCWGIGQKHG